MSDGIVKFYKNPHRDEVDDPKKNQPQYKQMGVVPDSTDRVSFKPEVDPLNPRTRALSIRETVNKPTQQVPPVGLVNVGNNMEHTWSGVDGEIYDDISSLELDPNQKMIDNNDYVDPNVESTKPISNFVKQQMEIVYEERFGKLPEKEEEKKFLTEKDLKEALTSELQEKISSLPLIKEDEYILMIDGVVIDIGSLEKVEEQANLLVFGDHELCAGHPVPAENLLILKRVKIKIGLFLE